MNYCEVCGRRNTGWRPVPHWGKWCCPACAQDVPVQRAADELAKRRALLARLEAEGTDNEGVLRFRREVEQSIKRLEERENHEAEQDQGRAEGEENLHRD